MRKLIDAIKSHWFAMTTPMDEQVELVLQEQDSSYKYVVLNSLGQEMNEDVATFPSFANAYADSMLKVADVLVGQAPYTQTALVSYFRLAAGQYTRSDYRTQAIERLIEHGEKASLEDRLRIYHVVSTNAPAGSDLEVKAQEMIKKYTDLKKGRSAPSQLHR